MIRQFVFGAFVGFMSLLLLSAHSHPAHAQDDPAAFKKGSCVEKIALVKKTPGHWHALAESSPDKKRNYSCGSVWNQPSKAAAIKRAIAACESEVAIPPIWGRVGTCRIKAVK